MKCPACAGRTRVTDSRPSGDGIRRYRRCISCHTSFSTQEVLIDHAIPRGERQVLVAIPKRLAAQLHELAAALGKIADGQHTHAGLVSGKTPLTAKDALCKVDGQEIGYDPATRTKPSG